MSVPLPVKHKIPYKVIILAFLVSTGVVLNMLGWFDWQRFVDAGERYAGTWWFPSAVILSKVVLYTFALPGSMLVWVSGLFYDSVMATLVIVSGGTCGAIAAYLFARSLSGRDAVGVQSSRFFRFLQNNTDLATLCAIRTLPNFPHSVINYGSGILNVPLPRFIISTVVGFAIKGYLYASIIRSAATAGNLSDAVDIKAVGSLVIVASLFLIGKYVLQHYRPNGP